MPTKLLLCDNRADVVEAFTQRFAEPPPSKLGNPPLSGELEIRQADLFESSADAVLLPGNSFGFLDRGLELVACERWGFELQDLLRDRIREEFFGELLVGEALCVPVPGAPDRTIVYAPIYRTPRSIEGSLNAYLAARGAFLALSRHRPELRELAVTGLGTGSAGLHPVISARQIRYAWDLVRGARGFGDKNLTRLTRRERKLASLPTAMLEGGDD